MEVTWAGTNPLGPSTQEMGPGAHHETLNGQCGLNFWRILTFHQFICLNEPILMLDFRSRMSMSLKRGP